MAQGMDNTMQFSFSLTCTIFYLSRMKNPTCDAALCTKYTVHGSYPFLNKKFKDFSRTHFSFFKDSIQCKKEPGVYVCFTSFTP